MLVVLADRHLCLLELALELGDARHLGSLLLLVQPRVIAQLPFKLAEPHRPLAREPAVLVLRRPQPALEPGQSAPRVVQLALELAGPRHSFVARELGVPQLPLEGRDLREGLVVPAVRHRSSHLALELRQSCPRSGLVLLVLALGLLEDIVDPNPHLLLGLG